jgi:phosphate starvation-inducible PhoH-like protein
MEKGWHIQSSDIDYAHRILSEDITFELADIFLDTVFISSQKRVITPKSIAQRLYIEYMRNFDMVFAIGPAGTGKTYLAMAMAVSYLLERKVQRIILARPAVEAGERLGFLPGDLAEKVNPYLRPLYDALYDMIDMERATSLLNKGLIEVAPLAFMRGRTLNDSFIILDEAQNTTSEQMKMFLTRLGFGSRAIITGDITQVDLPTEKVSGLVEAEKILKKYASIRFVHFSEVDVIRHPLVQDIIKAYNHLDKEKTANFKR